MNAAQLRMYRGEWGKARKALRALGFTPTEADARRKRIHVAAGAVKYGKPKSSLYLNNGDIDRVLAIFRSYSDPANLQAQLDAVNQPVKRALCAAQFLLEDLGIADASREAYLDGICKRACKRSLLDSTDDDLVTILGALTHTWQHKKDIPHTHRQKMAEIKAADDALVAQQVDEEDPF